MSGSERAAGTGGSVVVTRCQVCESPGLESVLFLGFMPPVNQMRPIGEAPHEQPSYPAEVLRCPTCHLVQLGLIVDPRILFPKEYPYTSRTTKVLRDNFAELYKEASGLMDLRNDDLVVDIGSNDGNLLTNFKGKHRVLGVTPEEVGKIAIADGIPTILDYFSPALARRVRAEQGPAKVVTATNVFAHIEGVHDVLSGIIHMLARDGVFISESHYVGAVVRGLQYDTVYHEHLRYYSLTSLKFLLAQHGLKVFHVKKIPTHGGSIRVYAAREGEYEVESSVKAFLAEEQATVLDPKALHEWKRRVVASKLALHALLHDLKKQGKRVVGIGAPSRASTLITYTGLDDGILDAVYEIKGSHKIGKCMPGTLIPVLEESGLYETQPDYAMLLSWHIADELIPKIRDKGFKGGFIVPLPEPRIVQ